MSKHRAKKGDYYIAKDCRHMKNMHLHIARQPKTILEQVIMSRNRVGKEKKEVQFTSPFYILTSGRPLLEYESQAKLYNFLQVPNTPQKHWSNSNGWVMAELISVMYDEVKDAIKKEISYARFIAMSADEVTTVDNSSWILVHA